MSDIFFSYSSKDREPVRQVFDTLTTEGFNVFWDQAVPVNIDWDTWIRQHLASSKCVMVFWSANSVASDNVRHEATVAKQQGKLVPVLLESLAPDQFPMGLYSTQGANLASWTGNPQDPEWEKLKNEVEAKLTPLWVRQRIQELEAELLASNTRWEFFSSRDRSFEAQIEKHLNAQIKLSREKDLALEEMENLKVKIAELTEMREEQERSIQELTENLTKSRQDLTVALKEIEEEKHRYIEQQSLVKKLSTEKEALEQRLKLSQEYCGNIELSLKEYENLVGAFEENQLPQESTTPFGKLLKAVAYPGTVAMGEYETTSENDNERSFKLETSAKTDVLDRGLLEIIMIFLKWFFVIILIIVGLFFGLAGLTDFAANNTNKGIDMIFIGLSVVAFFIGYWIKPR